MSLIINGMLGLGDGIYQRAFVRQLGDVHLLTPWSQLYADMPRVKCCRPNTKLRTQAINEARPGTPWHELPPGPQVKIHYSGEGIVRGMSRAFGVHPGPFDLPDFGPSPVEGRYVVVRPVTVRAEWRADSRNPLPEYVAQAAAYARAQGYRVISVADLADGAEWALDPLPVADVTLHKGELPVEQLLALVQGAAAVIGGIGWIVPACIAAKVPAWVVCGGQGGFNAPELIHVPGADHVRYAVPDNFCRCTQRAHQCDKRIAGHAEKFAAWFDGHVALV